jgi:hypothetical protein
MRELLFRGGIWLERGLRMGLAEAAESTNGWIEGFRINPREASANPVGLKAELELKRRPLCSPPWLKRSIGVTEARRLLTSQRRWLTAPEKHPLITRARHALRPFDSGQTTHLIAKT